MVSAKHLPSSWEAGIVARAGQRLPRDQPPGETPLPSVTQPAATEVAASCDSRAPEAVTSFPGHQAPAPHSTVVLNPTKHGVLPANHQTRGHVGDPNTAPKPKRGQDLPKVQQKLLQIWKLVRTPRRFPRSFGRAAGLSRGAGTSPSSGPQWGERRGALGRRRPGPEANAEGAWVSAPSCAEL